MKRSKNITKAKKSVDKYPLVMVQWNDAQSDAAWGEIEDINKWADEKYIVNEVGWMLSKTKTHIVICSELGSDGSVGNRTKIPNQWIIKKVVLS